jgi:hypothetical protein
MTRLRKVRVHVKKRNFICDIPSKYFTLLEKAFIFINMPASRTGGLRSMVLTSMWGAKFPLYIFGFFLRYFFTNIILKYCLEGIETTKRIFFKVSVIFDQRS